MVCVWRVWGEEGIVSYWIAENKEGKWVLGFESNDPTQILKGYKTSVRLHGSLNVMLIQRRAVTVDVPNAKFTYPQGCEEGVEA